MRLCLYTHYRYRPKKNPYSPFLSLFTPQKIKIKKSKMLKFLIMLTILNPTRSTSCHGGGIFLKQNTLTEKTTIPFTYDCTQTQLQSKIAKLKSQPLYVSYYLNHFNKREIEETEGSGNYDNEEDYEESLESDTEIEPSRHFIPILPTPSLVLENDIVSVTSSYYEELKSSSSFIQPTRSLSILKELTSHEIFMGSGDGPILQTPIIELPSQPINKERRKLQKTVLNAGQKFEKVIGQNCRNLTQNSEKITNSWLKPNKKGLIGLPTTEDISEYEYELECENIVYEIFLAVRQNQKSRNFNHYFRIEFGSVGNDIEKFLELIDFVDMDLIVLKTGKVFPFFIEFVVMEIVDKGVEIGSCPLELLSKTLKNLQTKTYPKNYSIKKIELHPLNPLCDQTDLSKITNKTKTTKENYPPAIKNQIDSINGQPGRYLNYKIKNDFCYDPEDGETHRLKISLKNLKDFKNFDQHFWMGFDSKNYELFGLPMEVSEFSAVIVCEDSGGKTAQDVIEVKIEQINPTNYNSEFSLHFQSIPFTPLAIRKFLEKLTQILSNEIEVKSIAESNNHVLFKWYNTSNPNSEIELGVIRKILFSDEGPVNREIRMAFSPDFNLTSGGVSGGAVINTGIVPGSSEGGKTNSEEDRNGLFDFEKEKETVFEDQNNDWIGSVLSYESGYLTTYIIPSILIAVMILLALIIACLLSRKNKSLGGRDLDSEEEKKFVNKKGVKGGVPVIFQDELEVQQGSLRGGQCSSPAPPVYQQQQGSFGRGQGQNQNQNQGQQGQHVQPNRGSTPLPPDYQSNYNQYNNSLRSRPHPQTQNRPLYGQQVLPSYQPPPALLQHNQHNRNQQQPFFQPNNNNMNIIRPSYVPP